MLLGSVALRTHRNRRKRRQKPCCYAEFHPSRKLLGQKQPRHDAVVVVYWPGDDDDDGLFVLAQSAKDAAAASRCLHE